LFINRVCVIVSVVLCLLEVDSLFIYKLVIVYQPRMCHCISCIMSIGSRQLIYI